MSLTANASSLTASHAGVDEGFGADGASTVTLESKTNFIQGVDEGAAIATARPLHVGGRFIVVQTTITDSHEALVAQITQTQAVLRS